MSALTILYIILAIILLFCALLFLRIRFVIECNTDISVKLSIFGIKFSLYPKNKSKIRLSAFKKGYPEQAEKKQQKKPQKEKDTPATPFTNKISTLTRLARLIFSRFFRHLRLDISKIIVTVGAKDAATCAVTYGVIAQSVAYLLEFLDTHLKINKKRRGTIHVLCDFTAESVTYDILISASMTVWQLLDIGISFAYNYLKGEDIFNIFKQKQ